MKTKQRSLVALTGFCLMMAAFLVYIPDVARSQLGQTTSDENIPILDFDSEIRKQSKDSVRRQRDSVYVGQLRRAIAELPKGETLLPTSSHFWVGLKALPVEPSDVIVIGQINSVSAHLTDDRTGIYSEFSVSVHKVFKGTNRSIDVGTILNPTRSGGAVRFTSGKVQRYIAERHGWPRTGASYLFFLKYEKETLVLVTGYDVSFDTVNPLDGEDRTDPQSVLPFAKYRKAPRSELMGDLKKELMQERRPL